MQTSSAPFLEISSGRDHKVGQRRAKMPDTQGRILQDPPGAVDDIKHLENSIGRIKFSFLRFKACENGMSSFQAEDNAPSAQRNC